MEKAKAWAKEAIDRPKYLATGADLETFSALAERRKDWLSTREHAFVAASDDAHETEEKRKADKAAKLKRQVFWSRIFAAAAAIALVVVGFFGLNLHRANTNLERSTRNLEQSTKEAQQNLRTARENLSSALTALALTELDKRPVDAAKLALAAWPRNAAMDMPKREVTLNAVSRSLAGLHERRRIPAGASVARMWDAATGQELRAFKGHEDRVNSVAFSPDGAHVLTGSEDKTARLWDVATGQEIRASKGHAGAVSSVAFSPDGSRVLTGSPDRTACLWDAVTGEEILAFKGHEDRVNSVAFSPDGTRVLTGSFDKTARLWDISTVPKGNIFDIACAWLPDHDLSGLGKDYGLDLSREAPICQKDARGRFTTPLPDPPTPK